MRILGYYRISVVLKSVQAADMFPFSGILVFLVYQYWTPCETVLLVFPIKDTLILATVHSITEGLMHNDMEDYNIGQQTTPRFIADIIAKPKEFLCPGSKP